MKVEEAVFRAHLRICLYRSVLCLLENGRNRWAESLVDDVVRQGAISKDEGVDILLRAQKLNRGDYEH